MQQMHRSQLHRTAETIDDHLSNAELLVSHLAFNPKLNENLKNLDFRYHYKEIHDIYQSLLVMEGSNPLFDRVELFINEPQPVVFTRDLYRFLGEEKTAQTYQQLLEPSQSLYWHHTGNSIMLVHKIPGLAIGQVRPFGVLVVHLNEAKVLNLVQTLTPYDRGFTLLFEEHGKVLMSGGDGSI